MPERNGTRREVIKRWYAVFFFASKLLIVDVVTKELAVGYLKGSAPRSVIDGFLSLAYVENRGCAWGFLQNQVWPLAAFGALALAAIIWKRTVVFADSKAAEPLLYAGIIGNLIDRLFRGYVIDFFDFHWGELYHFPCFNVADVCITLAAGLLILGSFRKHQ